MAKTTGGTLKYNEFLSYLKQSSPVPLYLFHGEERYLIQEGLNLLIERLVDPSTREFNYQTLFGYETTAGEIINACQTLPLLSPHRMVVVKGFETLSSNEQEALIPYFQDPSPFTHLVLTAEKIDLRKKMCQVLQSRGLIVACPPLFESQLSSWIRNLAHTLDLKLSDEAVTELKEKIGSNLSRLRSEMEKISLYRQSKTGIIEREDVLVVLGSERDQSVFDLIRKIGVKDLEGALKTLKKILESGDHPLLILTLLIRQYRLLWRAKELQERGITPREILKTLGVHPYYGQALLKQAGNYSEEQLQESFSLFKEVDSSLKENYHAPHLLLETLTLHLCQTAMPSTKKGHLF